MDVKMHAQLQALFDREAIRDLIYRYCHGADRGDAAVLENVYWPEATDDHGVFKGPAAEYIKFLLNMGQQMDQLHHMAGNILIRIDDDLAQAETYFFSYQRIKDEAGEPRDLFASGRYIDTLERRQGDWRILNRKVVFDWFRLLEDSADWGQGLLGSAVPMGGRAPMDFGSQLFARNALTRPLIVR